MAESNIDYRQIVEDFYVGHIKNRLRELETADDDEQTRWIWELIQNAKDCSKELVNVSQNTARFKAVDIKIEYDVKKKIVIFKHNGYPFTNETLNSLMYKYSSKNDKEESTGRFGTGFMTSHTLSRIVYIKAPFLFKKNDTYKLKYVETTVFREGSNEEQLRTEFKKMEKSRKFSQINNKNANHKWTIFTYNLNSDIGIHSANLGIQSLYNNIKKVFLLCNKVNSIKINNEELLNLSMISTKSLKISDDSNYKIIEKNIKDDKFVIASFEEINQQYSEKYSKDQGKEFSTKKLVFDILIPVNSNCQIIDRKDNEICLFCTFPLIGSEKCQLPYIINCPVFETSTERKGLILDGEEKNSDGILTNTGLNQLILNKSIDLFSSVIDWFIKNNYSNFASFSNGIQLNSEQMNPYIHKIRSIFENKPIVKDSSNKPLPLNMVLFLDFNNIKDKKAFHDLASSFYLNVASYDDCIKWNNKTWNELSVLNVKTFVENVKCIENNELHIKRNKKLFTDGLSSLTKNDFSFLNRFYSFLLNEETKSKTFIDIAHNSLYLKEKIILNSNCQFVYLINLKSNSKLSEDLNKIMEQCKSWNDSIIHPEIQSFKSLIPEETIDNAKQAIDYYIKNNNDIDVLLSFVKFVLKNDKQREKMYQIADFFYNVPMKITVTDVDSSIWEKVDFHLLKHINTKISKKLNSKIDESSLENYKIFYELYHQIYGKTDFLVPNYNLKLTKLNQLKFLSNEIPQVLLDTIKSFSDFDAYIHPSIKCDFLKNEVDDLDYFINLFKSEDFFFSDEDEIIKDRLFAILSIIPPEKNKRLYNFQLKIREVAQFFFDENIKMTKSNIKDETFWETADEIVIEYIIKNLKKFKTIQCLKSQFDDDETNIFNYLNHFYSIISSNYKEKKDIILIPNHNGKFLRSDELSIGKGLDEKLYDLINKTNSEFDIRDKIAHPKVQCDFLKIMDFEYFIKLFNEKLSEEQLLNDKNMVDAIFSDLNIFDEHSKNIFERLYVANIKNRLNEIKNPTDSDKIRWSMELMQNAKDSLYSPSNINEQKYVEINIEVSYKKKKPIKVCFSHNGPAFTENSFYGLLFKICEGKNNLKTTGKFGTGFISTHVLSKIVNISGNRIDDNNKITGFSITLYREGTKDDNIIKDFKKMSKSFKSFPNDLPLTKFEYQITSKESIECVELGLIHFKNHISNVLINCKEIKCVNLYENDKKTTFSASKIFEQQYNQFLYFKYQTLSNNDLLKQFILLENEENISISIEYDNDNCKIIPRNKETESIFSVFPLVGSKAHILPFFLNSSNLEPVTERNALILHGKEVINGETTNAGKNRSIMMNSIKLFEELIQILNESKCSNMYELTYGLSLSTSPYESFDLKWYTNTFLKEIRKVVLNNIEAKTFLGESILLKDIYFPSYKISDKYIQIFIKLSSRFYNNIISVEDALLWRHRLWKTIDMISVEDLMIKVKNEDSIINEEKLVFLNEFLSFIWNFDKDLLYNYELIPDMNCNFHKLSNDSNNLRECKTVSKKIIKMMESIQIPWKSTHMNNLITTIKLSEDKTTDAEGKIIEQIKRDNKLSLMLMKFVLNNDKLRQNMYEFVNELNIKKYTKPTIVSNIDPKVWELADNYVLKLIVSKIESFNSTKVSDHINFFTRFLPIFFDKFSRDKTFINSKKNNT